MSEWLAVEAIVRQRDKENQANAIAKLSSESMSAETGPPPQLHRDLSNDVSMTDLLIRNIDQNCTQELDSREGL